MGKNISENDIIKNMEDAGCDEACIRHFLKCFRQGNEKEELETLANHRDCILDKLHEAPVSYTHLTLPTKRIV